MKKTDLLHPAISAIIASLGHGDMLVIGDAGLPIPNGPQRIDLALTPGIPRFDDTLRAVLSEMQVERWVVAEESSATCPDLLALMRAQLADAQQQTVAHAELKHLSHQARAVIRTGECTPYANVILVAGVTF